MKTALLPLLLTPLLLHADTTIDPAAAHAYAANFGWLNTRGDVANGAIIGEFVCTGYIYSANAGWISLGSGTPANGIRYLNNTATDCGVNTQDYSSAGGNMEARLRGYAYGSNLGWIAFEDIGNPRVDLATGQLRGSGYSANAGWIVLEGTGVTVRTRALVPGLDSDRDGIADAWERLYARNLTTMTAMTDSDGDGVPDPDEYAADTNPLLASDALRITGFVAPRQLVPLGPFLTDLTWTSKPTRWYSIEAGPDLSGAWKPQVENLLPAAGGASLLSFRDSAGLQRFYRVRAKLPFAP